MIKILFKLGEHNEHLLLVDPSSFSVVISNERKRTYIFQVFY